MLTKIIITPEQTWGHHGADLTIASWTMFTGTNRGLHHNRLIQISTLIIITTTTTTTTWFKSLVVVAEYKCSTNWGDGKRNKSTQMNKSSKLCKTRREKPSNWSVRHTQVFYRSFFFPLTFRYRLLSKDKKLYIYLFKSIKSSVWTSAMTDRVAPLLSTIWLPHYYYMIILLLGKPLILSPG